MVLGHGTQARYALVDGDQLVVDVLLGVISSCSGGICYNFVM